MSQTLSLTPGKYNLFIAPPVAGVDFAGTPTPTVTYQWKKNGTAIAGQTGSLITGVWVEQTGGTVDVVDGDVISIDIILTNVVDVSTKTISATIDSAIPTPVISPVSIRQLSGGTYQTVTNLANTDIGEQVIVASNTGGTVTTTPPVLPTYQWRRNFVPIAGETSQTYTLQADDADSIIECRVTATNSGGTATAVASVSVGTVASTGWTDFTQYADANSRIMYVAADGNDAIASHYSIAQVGADPSQPIIQVVAYRTFDAARAMVRPEHRDWILFRRGDTFDLPNGLYSHGVNSPFVHLAADAPIRKVIAAYGPEALARPVLTSAALAMIRAFGVGSGTGDRRYLNTAFVSLDIRPDNNSCCELKGIRNLWFEDCVISGANSMSAYKWSEDPIERYGGGIVMRRCVVVDAFRLVGGHVQGLFASKIEGLRLEECVFDRNGYVEDPTDPSTWTAPLQADNANSSAMAAGSGVQPQRTWFSRNLYLSSYSDLFIRGCVLSRSASSHQMRVGGVAERNAFLWNDAATSPKTQADRRPWLTGVTLRDNLVMHSDHLLAQANSDAGLTATVGTGYRAKVENNIIAHFTRQSKAMIQCVGLENYSDNPAEHGDEATVSGNVLVTESGIGLGLRGRTGRWSNGYNAYVGSQNDIAINGTAITTTELVQPQAWTLGANRLNATQFRIGDPDNRQTITFAQWQANGFDAGSSQFATIEAIAIDAGWMNTPDAQGRVGWQRDIVSYMQSIDPSYAVDENVTVDDGVPQQNRRASAPRVWEVLAGLHAASNAASMAESQAKLTARRYHAFLTFIDRARQNRKGVWDVRYTADAINNYIRSGFGKAAVSGGYTADLPENEN